MRDARDRLTVRTYRGRRYVCPVWCKHETTIDLVLLETSYGLRIAVERGNDHPSYFSCAVRYVKTITLPYDVYYARQMTKTANSVCDRAKQGTPIQFRMFRLSQGLSYKFWE